MNLSEKLEKYFTGKKITLEYALLKEILNDLYDDEKIKNRELERIDMYETREIFLGKKVPNILSIGSLIYGIATNNLLMGCFGIAVSESARSFLDFYFTKNRRKRLIFFNDKLNKKRDCLQRYYSNKKEDEENERVEDDEFRIDTSGYQGWLNPNEEDPE